VAQTILNTSFRMFPDSAAARGQTSAAEQPTADQVAFARLLRGMHL
jgi:hypothetical protein